MELALLTIAAVFAALPLALTGPRRRLALPVLVGAAALAAGIGLGTLDDDDAPPQRPVEVREDGYVSSDACQSCHPSEYASWHASYHRTMTQLATPDALAGEFDGVEVVLWGQRYRFERRGDQLWVDMPDPESGLSKPHRALPPDAADRAPRVERPVVMLTGSHHYQVLWVPRSMEPGARELLNLRIVYLIGERRWIPRSAAFLMPPEIRQGVVPWHMSCIKCHATRGRPGVEAATDVIEFGISCEACHGPAEEHIRVNQNPLRRYARHLTGGPDSSVTNPAQLDHARASHVCAQCHSMLAIPDAEDYIAHGTRFRPGQDIHETYPNIRGEVLSDEQAPERLWGDGDARVTGGEWVGMSGSRCFTEGDLACTTCHSMHDALDPDDQLARGAERDDACLECHDAGSYRDAAHTHHADGSPGSACYNCHMPHTSYGLLKAVRSHRVDSPELAGSERSRKPNACSLCHLDRTLAWTAEQLTRLYGQPPRELAPEHHQIAEGVRVLLRGDAGQRALIAWAMGWAPARAASGSEWMAPFLTLTLNDPYDAVRQVGFRSLRTLPGFEGIEFDPLASPELRVEQASDFIPRWFELHRDALGGLPRELLLDPTVGLRMQEIGALVRSRDNRPVMLSE